MAIPGFPVLSAVLVAVVASGSSERLEPWQIYAWTAVPVLATLVLFFLGFRALRRKRLIENVPTSKVEGVFLGLTELKGTAETKSPLKSYLAEIECVYYRYSIEEHWEKTETYTDSKGQTRTRTKSGWTTVASDDVRRPFDVRDETGALRVVPDRAEMDCNCVFSRTCGCSDPIYYGKGPATEVAHSTHTRRFSEYAIRPGQALYIMGTARLREDVVAPEIAYGKEDEMYLISTRSEEQVKRGYGLASFLELLFGALCAAAIPYTFRSLELDDWEGSARLYWPEMAGAAAIFAGCTFLGYLKLLYNGLVSVRNRVFNAWSQIDIQLKRRFDLIPNLVGCVKGYLQHEKETQEALARIRMDGVAGGAPSYPRAGAAAMAAAFANEQTRQLARLFAIVEKYPKLQADQPFLKLQQELARTERKIALARAFYNESVTCLNNRISTLPDVLIAGLTGFRAAEYFEIDAFERAPVELKLDEGEAAAAVGAPESVGKAGEAPKGSRGT